MKNPTVKEIVTQYLVENGYDGLCEDGRRCGCDIEDLMPCCEMSELCFAGYKVVPPKSVKRKYEFFICENKNGLPWGEFE